ncbi:gliding motility-associated C-terminal domain-containing protein [Lishizhenia tianjinensis]|uniref:Gliding motility-associated C-terminal domain-containing protein n=1 Tax=Lishizhenia tianjinensis TaxID=477690 RepID=A0A1I7A5A0_9FLAO|nr:gliding motility-associated C-terminal domain-containing protein [Lishizhenia tianjinensis]SFT70106.1 gliding motility-associated C-terminal domain-containing protein [Lishizhenia tianjinensis]
MKKFFASLLILVSFVSFVGAQSTIPCQLTITPSDTVSIFCGDSLRVVGSGLGTPLFNSDFNGSQLDVGWASSQIPLFSNPCGPSLDGTPSAWFGNGTDPRELVTISYDISCGAQVCFDLDFADHDPCGGCQDCEQPDAPGEGVHFMISTDGGATFTDVFYFAPSPTSAQPWYSWGNYCFDFPINPANTNVVFKWYQDVTSGTQFDHWGIDNVSINAGNCSYTYDWYDGSGNTNLSDTNTLAVSPPDDESYTLYYTDGVDTCSQTIFVDVIQMTATASADPDSVGCFDCTTLDIVPANVAPQGFSEYFDPTTSATVWDHITGGAIGAGCSSYYQNSMFFNGTGTREAVTNPVNTQSCSVLSFCLYMGSQYSSSTCGNAGPGEDIVLQYSTSGGPWTTIAVYDESIWDLSPSWKCYNVNLPANAQGNAVQFKWAQPTHTASLTADNWSLDHISMTCAPPTFTYVWEPAGQMNDNTLANPLACMADTSQNFIGTLTNTISGCSATDTTRVYIKNCGCEITNFTAAIDTCQGNGTFNVEGGVLFLDNPATGDLVFQASNGSGVYTDVQTGPFTEDSTYTYLITGIPSDGTPLEVMVFFVDEDTCSDTLYFTSPIAPVYLGGTGTGTYCAGDPVDDVVFDVTGTGPFEVHYTFNGTPTIATSTTTNFNLGNAEGLYVIDTLFDATCYYVVNDTFEIIVNPLPNVFAGTDQLICENESITLSGQGAQTYAWDNNVQDATPFVPGVGVVMYTVTGTDANGCVNTDSVEITVEALPDVSFTSDVVNGCMPLTVTFSNTTAGNIATCEWFINGEVITNTGQDVVYTFENSGTYDIELIVTSTNGCTNSLLEAAYIEVYPLPDAAFDASTFLIDNIESTVEFYNESTGATSYYWNFGDGTDSITDENPIYEFDGITSASFNVELTAVSQYGCIDKIIHPVILSGQTIYYIPNTFTPNGDPFNNVFQPVFTSGFDPYDFQMVIYNRWGEQIFISNDAKGYWDGTYKGKLVEDGIYTWRIEYKSLGNDERTVITGNVTVIR